ncbi:MAG: type II secretion system protein [Bdellovibrionales bacterium]|nr:type II secretion system protein [Bdellovibrionales bacterium]
MKKGFTLIELLVVIVIVALLAGIVLSGLKKTSNAPLRPSDQMATPHITNGELVSELRSEISRVEMLGSDAAKDEYIAKLQGQVLLAQEGITRSALEGEVARMEELPASLVKDKYLSVMRSELDEAVRNAGG